MFPNMYKSVIFCRLSATVQCARVVHTAHKIYTFILLKTTFCEQIVVQYAVFNMLICRQKQDCRKLEASENGVCLLISAITRVVSGSDVKLTPKLVYFENCASEVWMLMYGKSINHPVSEVKLTSELGPSMNSVLLRWAPSLNIRSKLKGERKTLKFGSDTSLVPGLPPHSLRFTNFLMTLSLQSI